MKTLKRQFSMDAVGIEELQLTGLTADDIVCLCGSFWVIPDSTVDNLVAFVKNKRGSLVVMYDERAAPLGSALDQLNHLLQSFGIGIEGRAVLNMAMHDDVHHPRNLKLISEDLPKLPGLEWKTGLMLPQTISLTVQQPAMSMLLSDRYCFPSQACLGKTSWMKAILYCSSGAIWDQTGKVFVMGTHAWVEDTWIEHLDNFTFLSYLMDWLASDQPCQRLKDKPADKTFVSCTKPIPDIASLAEMPRYCPQLTASNVRMTFDWSLLSFELEGLLTVKKLEDAMDIDHTHLDIIAPQFMLPPLPLQPAVFPNPSPQIPSPPFELFDLDAEIRDKRHRLDLAFERSINVHAFIEQGGGICGIRGNNSSDMLFKAFQEIVSYKR